MGNSVTGASIYKFIISELKKKPMTREDIIHICGELLCGDPQHNHGKLTVGGKSCSVRSRAGAIINEMVLKGTVAVDDAGLYYLTAGRPVIVRLDKCEKEIIKALTDSPKTKSELKSILKSALGTDKTASTRDDDMLATYMGQILKHLTANGDAVLTDGYYQLSPRLTARSDDINAMLSLKSDFLQRLHRKGGEFFEEYFMNLLRIYSERRGKKVLECYVTGGSADGGIDGVLKTEDDLGFREITMVQTKNRVELSNETDVRGFYGAVCAKRGTRGIFATTSDFHSGAVAFLEPLDDCIGVGGDRIFRMAIECRYGIKKVGNALEIDKILI